MPGNCAIFRSWNSGELLTASDLTTSFTTVGVTNMTPSCMDDYAIDTNQFRSVVDPYPASIVSLPNSLAGELERLRFILKTITGWSQWYAHTESVGSSPFVKKTGDTMTGSLLFTDNAIDIGASGATRPRTIFLGTSLVIGTTPAAAGTIRMPNDNAIAWRNAANSADHSIKINASDVLEMSSDILTLGQLTWRSGVGFKITLDHAASADRVWTFQDATDTVVGLATTDTLTNKTLTLPVIASISNGGTLTLPSGADTLVGRASTDTLTNKTLTTPTIGSFTNAQHNHTDAAGGGVIGFTPSFTSSDQTITLASVVTVAHGLGAKPSLIQLTIKNTTAEGGYSIGDELVVYGILSEQNGSNIGINVAFNATNVYVMTDAVTVTAKRRDTTERFFVTEANWVFVVRAWK